MLPRSYLCQLKMVQSIDIVLMLQAKLVQINIHYLSHGQQVLNLHTPSVTQVQLAPACTHHL